MRRAFVMPALLLLVVAIFATGCSTARHHTPEATQENFGVNMARQNLWREAMFRFQRAVDLNPTDAMAHNNLAVALEANGEFDKAAKEYREAMRLDKTNQYIQKNYSRYVEFVSRNKKRQQRQQTAAAAKTASTKESAPAGVQAPATTAAPAPASDPGSATSPQPAGTAPADVAPPPPPPQPQPAPPPAVKPPGDLP